MERMICSVCGGYDFRRNGYSRQGVQRYECVTVGDDGKKCHTKIKPLLVDIGDKEVTVKELVTENVRLAKTTIKNKDLNRIMTKTFREETRVDNAVIEYATELRKVIEKNPFKVKLPGTKIDRIFNGDIGIVQLSDIHFNELVDIVGNRYDFEVASQRLNLFAKKIINSFYLRGINTVYVCMTGDLLNSDRRTDELLSMAANRAEATFIAAKILYMFIAELSQFFDINVISVSGNESRIREEYTQIESLATDNFDFMIYGMLEANFKYSNSKVKFISGRSFEYLMNINGTTILVTHGNNLRGMNHSALSNAIAKWAKKGIIVNYIMCGHLHETTITDTLLRSGSLVGNNAYADVSLNLHSKASQNFYVMDAMGNIEATKCDLQNLPDDYPMYNFGDTDNAYNPKSVSKTRQVKSILEVVV